MLLLLLSLLQSCPTLCDPIDGSPPGFPVPGILQARTLEWVAISFSKCTFIVLETNIHLVSLFRHCSVSVFEFLLFSKWELRFFVLLLNLCIFRKLVWSSQFKVIGKQITSSRLVLEYLRNLLKKITIYIHHLKDFFIFSSKFCTAHIFLTLFTIVIIN